MGHFWTQHNPRRRCPHPRRRAVRAAESATFSLRHAESSHTFTRNLDRLKVAAQAHFKCACACAAKGGIGLRVSTILWGAKTESAKKKDSKTKKKVWGFLEKKKKKKKKK